MSLPNNQIQHQSMWSNHYGIIRNSYFPAIKTCCSGQHKIPSTKETICCLNYICNEFLSAGLCLGQSYISNRSLILIFPCFLDNANTRASSTFTCCPDKFRINTISIAIMQSELQVLLLISQTWCLREKTGTKETLKWKSATKEDRNWWQEAVRTAERIICGNLPLFRINTSPDAGKGQETSLQTHHTLDTTVLSSPLW